MENPNFKDEIFIATLERTIRRLWILCIMLIILLVVTNFAWLYYEKQFEEVVTTSESVDQDIDANDNDGDIIVNGIGDLNDGENKTEDKKNNN